MEIPIPFHLCLITDAPVILMKMFVLSPSSSSLNAYRGVWSAISNDQMVDEDATKALRYSQTTFALYRQTKAGLEEGACAPSSLLNCSGHEPVNQSSFSPANGNFHVISN